ncbi:DUF6122 family protein [Aureivirga sp. CE67]|uniref:DUF6122 family protein n=1 Tax=Aureivirga sp. CE67 TaxID=1788983 RepID=UPI001E5A7053|nr:DUF6122 family protein [Aureivirga sp. CE67]
MSQFLEILQPIVHYSLHFLVPGLIAYIFFRKNWKQAWLIMILTMLVDLDHLFATPIFAPGRCSINFHPLHSYYAIAFYFGMLFFPKLRIVGVGLLFHMFTDYQDCLWMWYVNN